MTKFSYLVPSLTLIAMILPVTETCQTMLPPSGSIANYILPSPPSFYI